MPWHLSTLEKDIDRVGSNFKLFFHCFKLQGVLRSMTVRRQLKGRL